MTQSNAPQALSIPVSDRDHIRGKPDAPFTLLEYGDYECDYCGRAYPVVRALREHFGDQLRFVFRNFPHASIHPHASVAAQAAEAAGSQGKFWEMHDLLFEHQTDLDTGDLTHYALQIGLEVYHFQSDLQSERFARRVEADHQGGVENGVHKTPTFFINGVYYGGPMELNAMIAAISR
ncbi:MAG TPA: DsbA family protein [Tepidisphaeraceae bacterium]|jgi:protein-disulfide isomerase|nr:DsbA family protein [Tepidisphaeraceae bacterium]